MTELLSAAQIGALVGLNPTAARQALWRAGYREQRGYLPEDAREFAAQRGVGLTLGQVGRAGELAAEVLAGKSKVLTEPEIEHLRQLARG